MYNSTSNNWHQQPLQDSYNDYGYQGGSGFNPQAQVGSQGRDGGGGWRSQEARHRDGYNNWNEWTGQGQGSQGWSSQGQGHQHLYNGYGYDHAHSHNANHSFDQQFQQQLNLELSTSYGYPQGYPSTGGAQWQTPFAPSPVAAQQNNWRNNNRSNHHHTDNNGHQHPHRTNFHRPNGSSQPQHAQHTRYDHASQPASAAPEEAQPLYNNRWDPLDQPRRYNMRPSTQVRSPSPGSWRSQGSQTGSPSRPASPSRTPHTPGKRSAKTRREGPAPEPTAEYIALVEEPATARSPERRPLLVLDLNNTLVCRRAKSGAGSAAPLARPFLATFLAYVTSRNAAGQARWQVAVYSSAKMQNVLKMLEALELVGPGAVEQTGLSTGHSQAKGQWQPGEVDKVGLVWSREWMGLTPREFDSNVETVKELAPLWAKLGLAQAEGVRRTLLLDDEASKALTQPHNHLPIEGFFVDSRDFPDPDQPPPQHTRFRTPSPPSSPSSPTSSPPPRPRHQPQPRQVFAPVSIRPGAPQAEDSALLATVYLLSRLEKETNFAQFVKGGGVERLREEAGGDEGCAEAGRRECERVGVRVEKAWWGGWGRVE